MFNLGSFRLQDMTACCAALRRLGEGAASLEDVAARITQFLYTNLTTQPDEDPACVLVRLFKTHPYGQLAPELQTLVDARLGRPATSPDMTCLTLLASTGAVPGWNDPTLSNQFRVIPLADQETLAKLPILAQLFAQFQFQIELPVLNQTTPSLLLDQQDRTINVFHVPEARNSPYVPEQKEFVVPFGVQSVLGFGGLLQTGEMFAVTLFTKIAVPSETAEHFKTFALSTKLILAPFEHERLILPTPPHASRPGETQKADTLASLQDRMATLESLLTVQEQAVEVQSARLEASLSACFQHTHELQAESLRFETLSAASPVGIFQTDADGRCLYTNAAWQAIFCLSLIESLDDGWTQAVSEADRAHLIAAWTQAVQRGQEFSMRYRIQRPNGTIRWVETLSRPLRDSNHTIIGHVGTTEDLTERREDKLQLQRSQALLHSVFDHLPNMVFVKDAQTLRFVEFNKAGETLTGFSREELLGKSDYDFFPREEADFFTEKDRAVLNARSLLDIPEEEIKTKYNGIRILQTKKVPLCDAQGVPQYLLGISEDITERKRAEKTMARSHDLMTSFIEHSPVAIAMLDRDLRYVAVSRRWRQDYRLGDQDLIGQHHYDVFPEIHAKKEWQAIHQRCLAGAAERREEERLVRADGSENWLRWEVHPWRDMTDAIGGIIMFTEDITERKQSEIARFRLQQAIDHGQDGLSLVDVEGRYTYSNPAYAAMYGYTREELLEKHWRNLFSPEWAAMVEQLYLPIVSKDGHWQGELVGLRKSGEAFDIDLSLTLLTEPGTTVQTLLCACRDISRRKQMERELMAAKDAAEAGARAKSEFLATMSHEIRTPMNGVLGMTGLLLDTPLTPEQREYAHTLKHSGESLMRIINDILDFSKIEAGKFTIEHIPFDLRLTIEDTLELLAPGAQAKHLELVGLIDARVPTAVLGDPGRIRQILTNLIGNAIKFTEKGEVLLQVMPTDKDNASTMLRFEVIDTGIGLSEDSQKKLFQAFSQADGSTARKHGGTGLGLAICKRLTNLMGGEIGMYSMPGTGTCVWFTIRIDAQTAPVSAAPSLLAETLAGLRICLIDDNATNRSLLQYHASSWDMHHSSAEDGPSALALLRRAAAQGTPFDLALVDMHMPGMDGLQLGRAIREDETLAHTRLILLTSLGRRGDAKLAQSSGFSAYLTKPIRGRQLAECLRTVLGRQEAAATAQPLITRHTLLEAAARTKHHLLVVDDNPVNQKVAAKMLEKLGHRVDLASNGKDALTACARLRYDLIFMDCQMPEMDGFEATQEIRKLEASREGHVPVIAMTANAMEGDREQCLASGMDDFVSKPVASQDLRRVLARWLSPAGQQEAA